MKEITSKSELIRHCIINTFLPTYSVCRNSQKLTHDIYYEAVFRNYVGKSKYKSNDAFVAESGNTDDHYLSPRLMIAAMIKFKKEVLYNSQEFADIFNLCSETICITRSQNNLVKYKNENNKFRVKTLTVEKYEDFGPWWDNEVNCFDSFPLKSKIPDFFTEYEKTLLE